MKTSKSQIIWSLCNLTSKDIEQLANIYQQQEPAVAQPCHHVLPRNIRPGHPGVSAVPLFTLSGCRSYPTSSPNIYLQYIYIIVSVYCFIYIPLYIFKYIFMMVCRFNPSCKPCPFQWSHMESYISHLRPKHVSSGRCPGDPSSTMEDAKLRKHNWTWQNAVVLFWSYLQIKTHKLSALHFQHHTEAINSYPPLLVQYQASSNTAQTAASGGAPRNLNHYQPSNCTKFI